MTTRTHPAPAPFTERCGIPVRGRLRVLAVLLAAAVAALAGCANEEGGASPTPSRSQSPSPTQTASPTPQTEPVVSGVYYMVDTRAGLRLAREMRDLPGDDPGKEAVEAMIAGADDPDYGTAWNPATEVLSVSRAGQAVTVDLSADARTANIGSEGAALMIQQLVYTVTEAVDREASVQLLIDGRPAGELWGVVSWDQPVTREDPLGVRSLVQIDTPREGATVSSPVKVEGEAAVFEANLPWRVIDASGAEVATGNTMTSEGQTFAPFSFTVELDPGTYTVEIVEDDPSGGEGGTPMTDSRSLTVG